MAPDSTGLLWINKDAQSKSLSNSKSDKSEKCKIHRHVQARRGSKSRRTIPYHHRTLESEPKEPQGFPSPSPQNSSITPDLGSVVPLEEDDQEQEEELNDTAQTKVVGQKWNQRVQTKIVSTGGALDPFSSFPVAVSPEILRQLRYFESIWVPSAFRSPSYGGNEQSTKPKEISDLIRTSLSDDLHMNSLLAAIAMRMQTVHGTGSQAGRAAAAGYASKAMHALRRCLQNGMPMTEQHNLDILFLAAYEMYCFNLKGTQAHLRALRAMKPGPFANAYVRKLSRNIDFFTAAASLCAPILHSTEQEALGTNIFETIPGRQNTLLGRTMGSAFFSHCELFESDILSIIEETVDCAEAAEIYRQQLCSLPNKHLQSADRSFLHVVDWSEKVAYQLLCQMPQNEQHGCKDPSIVLIECCCIALLMWLSYLPVGMMSSLEQQGSQDYRKMVPGRGTGLVNRLGSLNILEVGQSKSYLELILWILAVGIVCSVDPDDTEWCAQTFIRVARTFKSQPMRNSVNV